PPPTSRRRSPSAWSPGCSPTARPRPCTSPPTCPAATSTTTSSRRATAAASSPSSTPSGAASSQHRPTLLKGSTTTMTDSRSTITRRSVLRGALFTAAAVPFGVTLASCATGGGGGDDDPTTDGGGDATEPADASNPFGIEEGSSVETVIFNGGYGVDYVEFAAEIFNEMWGGEATVEPTTEITAALQPRFVAGDPPDLVDNSGAQSMGFGAILDQLEDLTDVVDAPNLEGTPIRDTLIAPNVLDSGIYDGKLAAINYVLTVYGVWYSKSLFDANGWTAPTTWAEALELGAAAKEQGKYLFAWGKEAATYYQTLAIDSAIKQGGDEVRLALENLEE